MADQTHSQAPSPDPIIEPRIRALTLSGHRKIHITPEWTSGLRPESTARHSDKFRALAENILKWAHDRFTRDRRGAKRRLNAAREPKKWPSVRPAYLRDRDQRPDVLDWARRRAREERNRHGNPGRTATLAGVCAVLSGSRRHGLPSLHPAKKGTWAASLEEGIEPDNDTRSKSSGGARRPNAEGRTPLPGWPELGATNPRETPRSPPQSSLSPRAPPQTTNPLRSKSHHSSPARLPTQKRQPRPDSDDERLRREAVWYYRTLAASGAAQLGEVNAFGALRRRAHAEEWQWAEACRKRKEEAAERGARRLARRGVVVRGFEWIVPRAGP